MAWRFGVQQRMRLGHQKWGEVCGACGGHLSRDLAAKAAVFEQSLDCIVTKGGGHVVLGPELQRAAGASRCVEWVRILYKIGIGRGLDHGYHPGTFANPAGQCKGSFATVLK